MPGDQAPISLLLDADDVLCGNRRGGRGINDRRLTLRREAYHVSWRDLSGDANVDRDVALAPLVVAIEDAVGRLEAERLNPTSRWPAKEIREAAGKLAAAERERDQALADLTAVKTSTS